jgi:hypothetical protein
MATILRRRSNILVEACTLCRGRHYTAAASLAKVGVDHAMSDLALAVKPDVKRFYAGKRLSAFLVSENTIDGKLAADLAEFAERAYCLMNTPTGERSDVHSLIHSAAKLRRRLREIQRSL